MELQLKDSGNNVRYPGRCGIGDASFSVKPKVVLQQLMTTHSTRNGRFTLVYDSFKTVKLQLPVFGQKKNTLKSEVVKFGRLRKLIVDVSDEKI